jgi:retinol dehydrogenase-12
MLRPCANSGHALNLQYSKEKELHVLFNNGYVAVLANCQNQRNNCNFLRGVMAPPIEQLTADGYDLQFGTNVVGPFYFTKLLLPTLISTAKSSPDGHARILATASPSHLFVALNFNTFKDGPARKAVSPDDLYAQSKVVCLDTSVRLSWSTNYIYVQGNIVVAKELAKRYGDQGIVSTSLNPGQ